MLDIDDAAKAVERYLPRRHFHLDDLTQPDEAALRARPSTPLLLPMLLLLTEVAGNPGVVDLL